MHLPLITIITVTYNAIETIEDTILSIKNQTYPNIEYIIIDGGSTDGTQNIINKHKEFVDFFISEPDKGIYDAMNKGISYAKGEWINFMNSGDKLYSSDTLSNLFNREIKNNILVLYGDVCFTFEKGRYFIPASPIDNIEYKLPFCHQSTFVRSSYLKINLFNLKFKVSSDYNLFYNIYKNNKDAFLYVSIIIAIYNFDFGFSVKNNLTCLKEYKIINGNSARHSEYGYYVTFIKEYIKGVLPKKISNYLKRKAMNKIYNNI